MNDLARLSLNQITAKAWTLPEAVRGCRDMGVPGIGLWRDKVAEVGVDRAARLVADAGLKVTSLCRGGFFTAQPEHIAQRRRDNRAAVDEAAALGTDVLILVCGGLTAGGGDLAAARRTVAGGIADLAPYAHERGVRLGIEPLHPMLCADRSVVVTLAQALDLAEQFPPDQVGVVVDAYHVWWDPDLPAQVRRAGDRIVSFQVCDWLDPLPDPLLGRGLPGQGVIDLRGMRHLVDRAGYDGPIEVEVFNAALWEAPGQEVLADVIRGYVHHVA